MNVVKKVFPVAGFIIISILTICFRSIPKGKTWNDYNVLYVKNSTVKSGVNIDSILKSCGIIEYVSLSGQNAPIMLTHNSIEEAMFKISIASADNSNSYLYDRQNYFYDSNGEYLLFYIPDTYSRLINDALVQLEKAGCTAGVDSTLAYLWLLPCIVIVLAAILLYFSKNKLLFAFTAVLPCIYVLCNSFYACAIAVSILLLSLFFVSNIYGRKGAVKKLLTSNILIPAALVISVAAAFSASALSGFFYILLLTGTFCAAVTAINLNNKSAARSAFQPVFIRRANKVSIYGKKANVIMPVVLAAGVLIIAYYIFGSLNIVSSKTQAKLKLPGKTQVQDSRLPDFEAFYRWNWNVITAPYKSLNPNGEADENHVVFPRYSTQDGLIVQTNTAIYYDQSFKQRLYDGIDDLDFNSIEGVIKLQGDDFCAGYTDSASYNVSIFGIIMIIICFTMLLFIYFSAIIGKGGRR